MSTRSTLDCTATSIWPLRKRPSRRLHASRRVRVQRSRPFPFTASSPLFRLLTHPFQRFDELLDLEHLDGLLLGRPGGGLLLCARHPVGIAVWPKAAIEAIVLSDLLLFAVKRSSRGQGRARKVARKKSVADGFEMASDEDVAGEERGRAGGQRRRPHQLPSSKPRHRPRQSRQTLEQGCMKERKKVRSFQRLLVLGSKRTALQHASVRSRLESSSSSGNSRLSMAIRRSSMTRGRWRQSDHETDPTGKKNHRRRRAL